MKGVPDITGGINDIWAYVRQDRPHRIPALVLSAVTALLIIYLFVGSFAQEPDRTPDIVYFENWTVDRTDAEVRREWMKRAKAANERNARNREAYQRLADGLGIGYDANEADRISAETNAVAVPGNEAVLAPE